jgi:hypothetical protein
MTPNPRFDPTRSGGFARLHERSTATLGINSRPPDSRTMKEMTYC